MLENNAITNTKDILIEYLRAFLKNPVNYLNISNVDFSKTIIYDKEPTQLKSFPAILLTAINGNYISSGIGDVTQEVVNDDGVVVAIRYSGMFELPVTIEIASRTTKERDILTDLISLTFRVLLKRQLESRGIIIKDMRFGGESEIQYDSDKVYISTLNFTTWSEWYRDIELLPLVGIDIDADYKE